MLDLSKINKNSIRREKILLSKDRSHDFFPPRSRANSLRTMPPSKSSLSLFPFGRTQTFVTVKHVPFSGVWDNVFQEPEIQPRVLRNRFFLNNISRLPATVLQTSVTMCLPVTDPDLELRLGGGRGGGENIACPAGFPSFCVFFFFFFFFYQNKGKGGPGPTGHSLRSATAFKYRITTSNEKEQFVGLVVVACTLNGGKLNVLVVLYIFDFSCKINTKSNETSWTMLTFAKRKNNTESSTSNMTLTTSRMADQDAW